jgi:peroxiredoxin
VSSSTIAEQVTAFNEGFTAQVGPDTAAVFVGEQRDLTAAGTPVDAIRPGTPLPAADLLDVDGHHVDLAGLVAGAPAVIVLYRGAWCPYCNITLRAYQEQVLPALPAGTRLIAISPQTPDGSRAAVANGDLGFTVLSDPANTFTRAVGVLTEPSAAARAAQRALGFDVADSNADGTAGVPMPTTLVVDAAGTVRFVDVHPDYTTRTEAKTILDAVTTLV